MKVKAEVETMIARIAASFQENWQAALSQTDPTGGESLAGETIGRGELENFLAGMYPTYFATNIANEVFRTLGSSGHLSREEAEAKVAAIAYRFIKDVLRDFHRNYGQALLRFGDDAQHFSRQELQTLMENWGIPKQIAADVLHCIFNTLRKDSKDRVTWGEARAKVPYYYVHYYR